MPITDHQAKYLAYELTKRRPSDSVEKLAGTPAVSMFTVESMARAGDHLILAACTDDETMLDEEQVRRLLTLPASTTHTLLDLPAQTKLDAFTATRQKEIQCEASELDALFFEPEATKIDGWADDLKVGLEREIKEFDRQIKETRRASITALTLEEKLASQKQIKTIEAQRNEKRRSLFEAQDAIDLQPEALIDKIEGKLQQSIAFLSLFSIRGTMS